MNTCCRVAIRSNHPPPNPEWDRNGGPIPGGGIIPGGGRGPSGAPAMGPRAGRLLLPPAGSVRPPLRRPGPGGDADPDTRFSRAVRPSERVTSKNRKYNQILQTHKRIWSKEKPSGHHSSGPARLGDPEGFCPGRCLCSAWGPCLTSPPVRGGLDRPTDWLGPRDELWLGGARKGFTTDAPAAVDGSARATPATGSGPRPL